MEKSRIILYQDQVNDFFMQYTNTIKNKSEIIDAVCINFFLFLIKKRISVFQLTIQNLIVWKITGIVYHYFLYTL